MTPSTLGVVRILAATSLRRWWNRVSAFYRKKSKGKREATARKGGRSMVTLVLVGALFLFQSFMISYTYVHLVVERVESHHAAEPDDDESVIEVEQAPERGSLGGRVWVRRAPPEAVLGPFALLLSVLVLALLFIGLGTGNSELSQVGWSMEWLFTFPVPTRALLLAKAGEYALTAIFTWFTFFPLCSTILWNAGWGAWGLLAGALSTLLVAGSIASVRLLIETALRKRAALHGIKNFQAICTLVGMLLLFVALGLLSGGRVPDLLFRVSDAIGGAVMHGPAACVLGLALHPGYALLVLGWTVGIILLCFRRSERLLADGLISAGGPYQGTRQPAKPSKRIGGILSKDLRLLARDRAFLVQSLIIPLVIVAFQFMVNPSFSEASSPRAVAVLAFGVAAYVLAFGGFRILTAEQNALWLLYSLPQRLDRMLRRKTILWGVAASIYALAVLAYAWRPRANMQIEDWLAPFLAVGGVYLCAFLAGAMGTIGFDPLEKELSKKVHPEWSMLYMAIAAIYGFGIMKADLWGLLTLNALTLFMVHAVWDRVRRRLPYLLDPTAIPPRRIEIGDGLVAAFVFFFIQQLVMVIAVGVGLPPVVALAFAYGIASLATVLLSLWALWRVKVRRLFPDLGFRALRPGAVLAGLATGALIAGGALGYLHLLRFNPVYRRAMEASGDLDLTSRVLLGLVFVVFAPLFEEFLFRGLLFRGFSRSLRLPFAVLGSALIFALLHPAPSFPPVFALGIATALLLHRTGVLWAPIAAHMAYNAIVTFAQFA
ncbi:MAG: lysostaphin resistance A-like protein [Planctomycetota bacterium]